MLAKLDKFHKSHRAPARDELSKLVARMHQLGFYPACILDVQDFTEEGQFRHEQIKSAIESVADCDFGYADAVREELDNMREWG